MWSACVGVCQLLCHKAICSITDEPSIRTHISTLNVLSEYMNQ